MSQIKIKLILCYITTVVLIAVANVSGDGSAPNAAGVSTIESPTFGVSKCNTNETGGSTVDSTLGFRLPFMDINIDHERNIRLMQEPHKQSIFLVHGKELYQVFVNGQERRISFIGSFSGSIQQMQLKSAEVILWRQYLLFVVASEEYVEVYQIAESTVMEQAASAARSESRNMTTMSFEPIQQLTLQGKFQKMVLFEVEQNRIVLLIAVNFTKLYGKIRTLVWQNTYFDPLEELKVPPLDVLSVVGKQRKYVIRGRIIKHKAQTVVTVYEIQMPSLNLRSKQTLTVGARNIHAVTFRKDIFLIACMSTQQKCNAFRMTNGQFTIYKESTSRDLAFDKFVAGAHFLVGTRHQEVRVYPNSRLDCYASFSSNDTDVGSILTLQNQPNEHFVLLIYKRPLHTLVRTIEMHNVADHVVGAMEKVDADDNAVYKHQHLFEDAIGGLRSLLLKRKSAMDVLRKALASLTLKLSNLRSPNAIHLNAGKVGVVRLVDVNLVSPIQLLERIDQLRSMHGHMRRARAAIEAPMRLKVKQLSVKNLIYDKPIIEGFPVFPSSQSPNMFTVQTQLTTHELHANRLVHKNRNTTNASNYRSFPNTFTTSIRMQQLNVERINNVSWTEFYASLFLRNRDTEIEGRLILQANTRIELLQTSLLNGLVVTDLFNLKLPQIVHSSILIARFFVTDLQATSVNGLNFAKDIIFRGGETFVETPVSMHQVSISGDLLYAGSKPNFQTTENQTTDFQQHYTGKIIINGSLIVHNLFSDNAEKTQLLIDGTQLSRKHIEQNYLLKTQPQMFNESLVFGNAKVSLTQLRTQFLNNHSTKQHLLRDQSPILEKPLYLIFMLASVKGDVLCRDYRSNFAVLNERAVRHGDVVNITATKVFRAPLVVDNFMTLQLNEMPVSNLVLKSQLQRNFIFEGNKTFDGAFISASANIATALNATYLNQMRLDELLNYDYQLTALFIPHPLEVSNIVFEQLNDIPFKQVFAKFNVVDERLVLHKDLIIEGNLKFEKNLNIAEINGIEWDSYQQSLVRVNEDARIAGQKRFLKELTVTKALTTHLLNNIDMSAVFENILLKSTPQQITEAYTFWNVSFNNLDVSIINGVPTEAFMDTRINELIIEGDVIVPKITVNGCMTGNLVSSFQFSNIEERLRDLPAKPWRNVVVHGNASWSFTTAVSSTEHEQLQYLHKNAMTHIGNHIVTGNVKLRKPLIRKMITSETFPKHSHLEFLASDCLLKGTSVTQLIRGKKSFVRNLRVQSADITSQLQLKLLNTIDVLRFNASLYRRSSGNIIVGPLHFNATPTFGHLKTQGRVNTIDPSLVYHGGANAVVPPLKIRNMRTVADFEVDTINDLSLNHFLKTRVLKQGKPQEVYGALTFENLILNKEAAMQVINDIAIDNLVFTKSDRLQAITGTKFVDGHLLLAGPAYVLRLNNHDLLDSYQQSVFVGKEQHFDHLIIDGATFNAGMIIDNALRDIDDEPVLSAFNCNDNNRDNEIELASDSIGKTLKKHLLYLDYALNTSVVWQESSEPVARVWLHELQRISQCKRQFLQVQRSKVSNTMFLSNVTTSLIMARSAQLDVKAENYCPVQYRKVRSKVTVTGANSTKTFGMKKYIEKLAIFTPHSKVCNTSLYSFVLLHATSLAVKRNEVRVLKVDSNTANITDWQSLTMGVGRHMEFYQHGDYAALLSVALVDHLPGVSIYHFGATTQKFQLLQVIDGAHDIMKVVVVENLKYQLILSCYLCQRISIYEYQQPESAATTADLALVANAAKRADNHNSSNITFEANKTAGKYQIFQILKLQGRLDKLLTFTLDDGSLHMLVVMENDYYYLYKYAYIQGWLPSTYGYFRDLQLALPIAEPYLLEVDGYGLLLLCSTDNKCSVVQAVVRH